MALLTDSQCKPRNCLKCNQQFKSSGPGNRICRKCTQINNQLNVSEAVLARQRGAKRHNGESMNPNDLPVDFL